jgi:hypothetical protein
MRIGDARMQRALRDSGELIGLNDRDQQGVGGRITDDRC